jgi:Subtilase family/PEP-CTERM motif
LREFSLAGIHRGALALALAWVVLGQPAHALVGSQSGPSIYEGTDINAWLGAGRFYGAGYTGTRAVVGAIDGGHVWSGHETLGQVNTFIDARSVLSQPGFGGAGVLGDVDRHATWVGAMLVGRGASAYQAGIAPGATLWSGAIANHWVGTPYTTDFFWTNGNALTEPYATMLLRGVDGRRADVVNSSWAGYGDTRGDSEFSIALDGIARASGRTLVFSAGNAGPAANSLSFPASGYNSIVVGALTDERHGYRQVAPSSSRGLQDYSGPDGFLPASRARVDLVAPGEGFTLAYYGGSSGGNRNGSAGESAGNLYVGNVGGTSFSAALVSGGATLLNDLAYDRFAGNDWAHDGQVIKAVMLNSARKTVGWSNLTSHDADGVWRTHQALDAAAGAGAMDLDRAFDQFTAGTTDLPGDGGGAVAAIGWDHGMLAEGGQANYFFTDPLLAGSRFSATLNWFVGRSWLGSTVAGELIGRDDSFTDLSLELFFADPTGGLRLVAASDTPTLNTEHLVVDLAQGGDYVLRVTWEGERYDLADNAWQTYGLAWEGIAAVPEAGTGLLLGLGLAALAWRRGLPRRRIRLS